jgi:predicted enzyme related to lactoylglutathione lyase
MEAPARIWKPVLDCNDVAVIREFWKWLLGAEIIMDMGERGAHLGPEGGPAQLCLQRVRAQPSGKNRMHLDVMADDLDGVVGEIPGRGGSVVSGPHVYGTYRWFVMADPEDNEFCLSVPFPGYEAMAR